MPCPCQHRCPPPACRVERPGGGSHELPLEGLWRPRARVSSQVRGARGKHAHVQTLAALFHQAAGQGGHGIEGGGWERHPARCRRAAQALPALCSLKRGWRVTVGLDISPEAGDNLRWWARHHAGVARVLCAHPSMPRPAFRLARPLPRRRRSHPTRAAPKPRPTIPLQ